jgi:Ca2+-binding RTX toxin-like protein
MHGAPGDDTIVGGWGDDLMVGGRGDDRLFGGRGDDTAHFRGGSAGYEIEATGNQVVVTDVDASNGDFGTDTLVNVEALRFADELVLT